MNKQEFIETLEAERRRRKLSQKVLAEEAGLDLRTVHNALKLRGNPTLATVMTLIELVGLEIQLVPKGFGSPTLALSSKASVPSVVDQALGQVP